MVLLSDFEAELLFPQAASSDRAITAPAVSPMTFFDVFFILKMNLLKVFLNRFMNCALHKIILTLFLSLYNDPFVNILLIVIIVRKYRTL